MTRLPNFVTFTGIDEWTDVEELKMLALVYPVEFGILISRKRMGEHPRYPSFAKAQAFCHSGFPTAVHLCGDVADEVMDFCFDDRSIPTFGARRVQINTRVPSVPAAQRFGQMVGARVILQSRGHSFPPEHDVDWLHDESGGTGARSYDLPLHDGRLVGYAGGISPDNVRQTIQTINSGARSWMPKPPIGWSVGAYWLDMESGVRDDDDHFSIKKAWQVCVNIWGDRRP